MITVLLLACYLPIGAAPLVVPWRWIEGRERWFRRTAWIPCAAAVLALALAAPLTRAMSYAVVLIPLAISFLSLAMGATGARLLVHVARDRRPWAGLAGLTLLAAVPFLAILPALLSTVFQAAQSLLAL